MLDCCTTFVDVDVDVVGGWEEVNGNHNNNAKIIIRLNRTSRGLVLSLLIVITEALCR